SCSMTEGEVKQVGTVFDDRELRKARDGVKGSFLTDEGSETGFYYTCRKGLFSIWRFGAVGRIADCFLGEHATIAGACYMPFKDGSDGIVIAVNDHSGDQTTAFLAYYSVDKARVVKKIKIRKEITCVATVLDNRKRKELDELHGNLRCSPHLVAVGTEGACCYLVHFGIDSPNECDPTLTYAPFATDICKNNRQENVFIIRSMNGEKIHVRADTLSITAIVYVKVCKLLIAGLSCGAFVTVSLSDAHSDIYYFSKGSVFSIAYQEANDDPHPVLYLWFAHSATTPGSSGSSRRHSAHILLVRVEFLVDDQLGIYARPFIQQPYLAWSPEGCCRWVSFRTICQKESFERSSSYGNLSEIRSPIGDGCNRNGSGVDSSLLIMTWINDAVACAEGALFDLNAFYYKRLVPKVLFDNTIAHQGAFISRFTLTNSKQLQLGLPLDIMANAHSVSRFGSALNDANDVLFYPSSLSLSLNVITSTHTFGISMHSIQEEVLNFAESNIDRAMNGRPNTASEWVVAVGLASSNSTIASKSENVEASLVVSALINHCRGKALKKWVGETSNATARARLAKQLWDEVEYAKLRFDEFSTPLFGSLGNDVSNPAVMWMSSSRSLFSICASLFAALAARSASGNSAERAELECHHRASLNLALYAKLVIFFRKRRILPEARGFRKIRDRLQEEHGRCSSAAAQNRKTLWIMALLEEMRSASADESFWMTEPGRAWYPPRCLLTLLAPMLVLQIMDTAKIKLIGYFLLDYDHITDDGLKIFDSFKHLFIQCDAALGDQIVEKWMSDHGLQIGERRNGDKYLEFIRKSEGPPSDLRSLIDYPLLGGEQIDFIRGRLLPKKDGVTLWNTFCMKRKYFDFLTPHDGQPRDVQWKADCDRWTTKVLSLLPHHLPVRFPLAVSGQSNKSESPLQEGSPVAEKERRRSLHSTLVDGKSVPRSRKRAPAKEPMLDSLAPKTNRSRIDNLEGMRSSEEKLDKSPVLDDRAAKLEKVLPEAELESVRRVLQTPPSRRRILLGTALFAESPVTPISLPAAPPASILKSNKRKELLGEDEQGSEPRHLRFDLPAGHFDTSSSSTTSENGGMNCFANKQQITQPNFNYESGDEDERVTTLETEERKGVTDGNAECSTLEQYQMMYGSFGASSAARLLDREGKASKNARSEKALGDRSSVSCTVIKERSFEEQEEPAELEPAVDAVSGTPGFSELRPIAQSHLPSLLPPGSSQGAVITVYEEQEWEGDEQSETAAGNSEKEEVYSDDLPPPSLDERYGKAMADVPETRIADETIVIKSRSFEEQSDDDFIGGDDVIGLRADTDGILKRSEVSSADREIKFSRREDRMKFILSNNEVVSDRRELQYETVFGRKEQPQSNVRNEDQDEGEQVYHTLCYQVIQRPEPEVVKEYSFEEQEWITEMDVTYDVKQEAVQNEESEEHGDAYKRDWRVEEKKLTEEITETELICEKERRVREIKRMLAEVEKQRTGERAGSVGSQAIVEDEISGRADQLQGSSACSVEYADIALHRDEKMAAVCQEVVEDVGTSTLLAPKITGRSVSVEPSTASRKSRRRSRSESARVISLTSTTPHCPAAVADRPRRRLAAGRKTIVDVITRNEKVTDSESVASAGETLLSEAVSKRTRSSSRTRSPARADVAADSEEPLTPSKRRRRPSRQNGDDQPHSLSVSPSRGPRRRLHLTEVPQSTEVSVPSSPSRSKAQTSQKQQPHAEDRIALSRSSSPTRSPSRRNRSGSRTSSPSRKVAAVETDEPVTSPSRHPRSSSTHSQGVAALEPGEPVTPSRRRKRTSSSQSQETLAVEIDKLSTPTRRRTRVPSSSQSHEDRTSSSDTLSQSLSPSRRSSRSSSIASSSRSRFFLRHFSEQFRDVQ
uniref:ELYS beta-propeller domain-containing protein n=1 Tax=Parascaris univalens TaxID=6257 RepID=A0A915AAQ4_PARUN